MKKRIIALVLILSLVLSMAIGLAACNEDGGYDYEIKVWVSEISGVKELTEQQIAAFAEANGITIKATVEGVTEGDSASQMVTDVESGADIYCFAQDQLARLVQAGALAQLGQSAAATVTANNDAGAVAASKVGDAIYCYPLTSDNGYFMYYDKRVISEDDIDSLESLIAACEAAGKNFSFEVETSAWYTASFFFAVGAHSNWTTDAETGAFVSVDDTFNSDAGLVAMKGLEKLTKSTSFVSSSNGSDFAAAVPSAVVVSGTWAKTAVEEALGAENMGVADLPSFTVDGETYHLGSFSGNKLMGVKPQVDVDKQAMLNQLALYLTNADCQAERFEQFGWGPSNKDVQASDEVQSDPTLAALAQQNAYATPQGQIHGSWWDLGKALGVASREAANEQGLKDALIAYENSMTALFNMDDAVLNAWTLIGTIDGTNWDVDVPMTELPTGTWTSEPVYITDTTEFKIRKGLNWDVSIGDGASNYLATGVTGYTTEGYYKVKAVVASDSEATVELIAADYTAPQSFGVTGSFGSINWDGDVVMTESPAGTWTATIDLAEGDQIKVRADADWAINYGADGVAGGDNIVISEAGTYTIVLVYSRWGTTTLTVTKA